MRCVPIDKLVMYAEIECEAGFVPEIIDINPVKYLEKPVWVSRSKKYFEITCEKSDLLKYADKNDRKEIELLIGKRIVISCIPQLKKGELL